MRGKINGEEKELYNISLYYKEKPLEQIPATSNSLNYNVLYFKNELNEYVVSKMKEIFESEGILEFFTFKGIDSSEEFQGQVQSQNYDIVIRGINMGLKKDISNIFMTSDPQINPSGYINNDMASNINQYFINDGKTKNDLLSSIHSKYSNEVPFIILGKVYGNLNIKKSSGISFPERLYDYRFIIDYIDNIIVSKRPKIDGKKILDNKKFINFIRKNISE
ncbi:hypothetical protein [Candidatus Vampirococcus lugosii]|uniref:Uncharacterized protein n=1 Tax=Candidatus Vampirococcus lugosii TaxID=2789015 RepID=A0ABS5QLG0_9BACT|nr:hypothetical protein [Candidatus Vampirococcus lugosii]MBS8121919.1 hypothetical protein [Candidatus Vampirococcus lugosii]